MEPIRGYNATMRIQALEESQQRTYTLRAVLSITSQVYNPCGFFTPLTVRSKMFLQVLRVDHGWKSPIKSEHLHSWNELLNDLKKVTEHELNRFIADTTDTNNKYNLHIFTDASKNVYACTFYVQVTN